MRFRIRHDLIAIAAVSLIGSGSARAAGGDDVNTSTQMNAATPTCLDKIAAARASYANQAAAAMIACLDAIVKCDDQADAATALMCRRALLMPNTGQCAVGTVDDSNVVSGNVVSNDGCSAKCTIEVPPPPGPSYALPAQGKTTRWNTSGIVISCTGAGHDGEIQAGAALAYVDNGDGTITDTNTGLMWEKLSDDGTIHDWKNSYAWHDAFAVKIATLNGDGGFAGHTDWRRPNIKELQSIVEYEMSYPGPMVTPSSMYADFPYFVWAVYFYDDNGNAYYKAYSYYVRAVRGGP